jgi:hypothetical protein
MLEDVRGRSEQRFHIIGFELEREDDKGENLKKSTHGDREKKRGEKLALFTTDALRKKLEGTGGRVNASRRTYWD